MKNNKTIMVVVIAVILVVVIAAFIYISGSNELAPAINQPLIGGQTDEGGCLIAAGYSWCEPKQKCLRIWEEKCYDTEEDALAEIFAKEHNQLIDETHVTIIKMQGSYASGSVSFGPEPGEGGGFLIRLDKGDWLIDFEGNGAVDCPKIRDLGYPQDVLDGYCDPVISLFTEAKARLIAEAACIKGGESLAPGYYNENTKTWWFDANLNSAREGCNPACVVDETTQTAEINWRCTGLIEPEK